MSVSTPSTDATASAAPMGYVHPDGASAVLYPGVTPSGQPSIFQFIEKGSGWRKVDLCASARITCNPWGEVAGYARSDGVNAVVYSAKVGNERRLHELTWDGARQRWSDNDLTAITKTSPVDGVPFPYVRSDKTNSIVYCQNNGEVRETFLSGKWNDASLREVARGGELADCDVCGPTAVGLSNGQSIVVYLGIDRHIHAYRIEGPAWHHHDLTAESHSAFSAAPCPTAYQRAEGVVSVMYKVATPGGYKLREITGEFKAPNWAWIDWDFSSSITPPAPLVEECPGELCNPGNAYGYVYEGVSRVVYLAKGGKIQEASLRPGRGWVLTTPTPSEVTGVEGALFPRPYLRRDGTPAIVYRSSDGSVHELRY